MLSKHSTSWATTHQTSSTLPLDSSFLSEEWIKEARNCSYPVKRNFFVPPYMRLLWRREESDTVLGYRWQYSGSDQGKRSEEPLAQPKIARCRMYRKMTAPGPHPAPAGLQWSWWSWNHVCSFSSIFITTCGFHPIYLRGIVCDYIMNIYDTLLDSMCR